MLSNVLFLALVAGSSAFLFNIKQEKWDGLKVTWGPNPANSNYFKHMPRTTKDAIAKGFKKISDCDTKANWRGARYVKNSDYTLVLLYDVKGYIAGIQTTVPSTEASGYPNANIRPPFVKDGDNYVLSAYFVDPSIICSTGRSASDFESQGTGTNLYIQNGTNAEKNSMMIPHKQTGMAGTMWTEGKCFYTMGKHYWYNTSEDMDCDDFWPVFLLYNSGELTGFGWAMGADLTSPHVEHPPKLVLGAFFKDTPKCLKKYKHLTTMHIYLTSSVLLDLC